MKAFSVLIVASLLTFGETLADEPTALELADLTAYRAALDGRPPGTAVSVTFRDLWDHAEAYQGKRVRVEGRVARRFRQGGFGTFPPLVESWAVTPSGDPFCLVYPAPSSDEAKSPENALPGALIRFEGVFLKRLEYKGSDTKRLAPLIVGDRVPSVISPAKATVSETNDPWNVDWALGLGAAALFALVLARQHLRTPFRYSPPKIRGDDSPPEFVDSAL